MAKNDDKQKKCYFCGSMIENFNDLVEKKMPLQTKSGQRMYRRQFHMGCLPKYVAGLEDKELRQEENSEWDKVYKYFQSNILGTDKPLDKHTCQRLLGLRLGQYYPQGSNTRILPRGYEFKIILITMKLVNMKVQHYLSTTQFAGQKHKIDGILRFITGEIADVHMRLESQKRSNEKLEKAPQPVTQEVDYTQGLKRKEGKKIKKGIDTGGLL